MLPSISRRAEQIANYSRFARKRLRPRAIMKMLQDSFKMAVEAATSEDLCYPTEEYAPMQLRDKKQWWTEGRRHTA